MGNRSKIAPDNKINKVKSLFAVQKGKCFLCGSPMLAIPDGNHELRYSKEHVIPRMTLKKTMDKTVIVLSHVRCNSRRGAKKLSKKEIERAREIERRAELINKLVVYELFNEL